LTDLNPEIEPGVIASFLFQAGKFEEAEKIFKEILEKNPLDFQSLVLLGNLALLKNKFFESEKLLLKAIKNYPEEPSPHALLAEVYYRQDNFVQAAKHLRYYGVNDMAERLESFEGIKPYQVEGEKESYKIKMVSVDPLPIVHVKINDKEEVNFLIDTGASEVFIDLDYSKEIGLMISEGNEGIYAGGKKAKTYTSKIDCITLGELKIENIPVNLLPVRQFSQIFGGTRIDGIIGTVLFYHFITTMDYPKGELIFRKLSNDQLTKFEHEIKERNPIIVPFWLVEDHFMVAWGKVNDAEPILLFVDTGLAGGGFTGSKMTLEEAKVKLDESKAFEGIGGGGKVKVIPFVVEKLTFGDAIEENISGMFTEVFPMEHKLGFRLGGIISHQFFKKYALTFDFIKMRFILVK